MRLALNMDPSDPTSPYYSPEGCEYSIYYAGQYLYVTPEILTGILTGLFMLFVISTGLSKLNSIGNNSTFVTKMPVLGKEA